MSEYVEDIIKVKCCADAYNNLVYVYQSGI